MSTIGTSSGNKTIAAITVGTASGNKAVLVGTVGTASGNKVFFSALSASAAPASYAQSTVVSPDTASQGPSTVTVTGGIGPFTYSWARTGGSALVSADSPTAASTTFSSFFAAPAVRTAVFVCTVTDTATGLNALTNSVSTNMRAL